MCGADAFIFSIVEINIGASLNESGYGFWSSIFLLLLETLLCEQPDTTNYVLNGVMYGNVDYCLIVTCVVISIIS